MIAAVNGALRLVPVWGVYALGSLPPVFLFYLGASGGLGVEPIKALEHAYGEAALKLIVLLLCITPLRRFAGVNLVKFRRAVGPS